MQLIREGVVCAGQIRFALRREGDVACFELVGRVLRRRSPCCGRPPRADLIPAEPDSASEECGEGEPDIEGNVHAVMVSMMNCRIVMVLATFDVPHWTAICALMFVFVESPVTTAVFSMSAVIPSFAAVP